MSALSIQVPFPVFNDRDGQPLDNGYVWIGVPNLPPQTNPVNVYFDEALTILAPQPLRTINGYISRAGSPAQVYIDGVNFSILVQDSKGSMVYNFPEGTGVSGDACGITYNPPFIGGVPTPVCEKLAGTKSLKDFGAVGDGVTDDTAAVQAAFNSGGVVSGSGLTYAISSGLNITDNLTILDVNLLAVGTGWSGNTADVDTDTIGKPILNVNLVVGQTLSYRNLDIDCGLESIDTVNNSIAAAGIVINGLSNIKGVNLRVRFYLGYGVWARERANDSYFEQVRLNQWSFGSPGWFDTTKRTAYGWVNSSGDYHVNILVSNYNKANIYCTTGCFTTQWSSVHPYNGNEQAIILDNIVINGGTGQIFTNVYLDNGGIKLINSFVHQFTSVRGVRVGDRIGQFIPFELIATEPNTTGNGLIINGFSYPTNVPIRFSTEGSGTWVPPENRMCIINNVIRNTPFLDGQTNSDYYLGKNYGARFTANQVRLFLSPYDSPITTVGARSHTLQLASQGLQNGISIANYSPVATTEVPVLRFAKARSSDLTAQPLDGDILGEVSAYGSLGSAIPNSAFPRNNASAQIRFVATNNFTPTSAPTAIQLWLTPGGSTQTVKYYDINTNELRPNSDGTVNLGSASFKWGTVFAATGAINTSDARSKVDVEDLSDAEKRVALKVKGLIKKFKFKEAVELKTDGARIHIGVIAQEVKEAFESEGLNAFAYGLLCYDEWGDEYEIQTKKEAVFDEEGTVLEDAVEESVLVRPAGNAYGVRYDELFAFVLGAM